MNHSITTRTGTALALAAPILAAAWAFAPLARPRTVVLADPPEQRPATPARVLDVAAFSAPLWVAPPAPPVAPPTPAPPPPLRIELLAIVRDGDSAHAIIHDLDADRIRAVGVGEPLGLATVDRIGDADITIRDDAGTRTVALANSRGAP